MDTIPTDAFVDILLRLPPSTRRRLRLVCRHWRGVIDESAAPGRPRVKLLVFTWSPPAAHVIDGGLPDGPHRELWRHSPRNNDDDVGGGGARRTVMELLGTCNGVLCLFEGGTTIRLANPATGETLSLPPLPRLAGVQRMLAGDWGPVRRARPEAYSFAYLPATGRYKVVHVPCYLDPSGGFNEVQVLTLGDAPAAWRWRDVPVPGASCCLKAGLVSVGGATHWLAEGAGRVVAFDLEAERVAWSGALPVQSGPGFLCHLAEVRGRLGVVGSVDELTPARVEVWVLDDDDSGGGGGGRGWTCRYRVQVHGVRQRLARPHFLHGDHLLTYDYEVGRSRIVVLAHRLNAALRCNEVRISERRPGTRVVVPNGYARFPTFAYLETGDLPALKLGDLLANKM